MPPSSYSGPSSVAGGAKDPPGASQPAAAVMPQPCDYLELQAMHRVLFPIDYEPEFFSKACHGLDAIYSWAALDASPPAPLPPPPVGGSGVVPGGRPAGGPGGAGEASTSGSGPNSYGSGGNGYLQAPSYSGAGYGGMAAGGSGGMSASPRLVGFITARIQWASDCEDTRLLAADRRAGGAGAGGVPGGSSAGSGSGGGPDQDTCQLLGAAMAAVGSVIGCGPGGCALGGRRQVAYILTLGVLDTHRQMGIATALLARVVEHALSLPLCRAIYLHVLPGNAPARAMYERAQFKCSQRLRRFYYINTPRAPVPGQTQYDACLYVRYINGGRPPLAWADVVRVVVRALLAVIAWVLARVRACTGPQGSAWCGGGRSRLLMAGGGGGGNGGAMGAFGGPGWGRQPAGLGPSGV